MRLKCFALTADTVGFFGVWIGPRPRAAVSSVQRLRMAANAGSVAFHVTLRVECRRIEATGNRVFSVDIGFRLMFLRHLFVSPRVYALIPCNLLGGWIRLSFPCLRTSHFPPIYDPSKTSSLL